jgi:hypothetical protein
MEGIISLDQEQNNILAKVSWIGYLRIVITTIFHTTILSVIGIIAINIFSNYRININPYQNQIILLGCILGSFVFLMFLYNVFFLRSVVLYYDDDGVWLFSGIFPWSRGIIGIKWQDMDEALYKTAFLSWLFKSYDLTISHRFTKSNEIVLPDMYQGNKAVIKINELLIKQHKKVK